MSRLQRVRGNRAVQRLVDERLETTSGSVRSGDGSEREAERVADRVLNGTGAGSFRRVEAGASGRTGPSIVGAGVPAAVRDVVRSPGRPLDPSTRQFMEARFGRDFHGVRVHTGDRAAESARAVGARAYTVGRDVAFATGEYAPRTTAGRRLLAHELTHVVQQETARVPATVQRQAAEGDTEQGTVRCSMTAKRETFGTGFCIEGTTDAPDGTRVSFHYLPGMTSCSRGSLMDMPPFGRTTVSDGEFSWTAPTNVGSMIPGVGRLFGAIVGSGTCCTRPVPGDCD